MKTIAQVLLLITILSCQQRQEEQSKIDSEKESPAELGKFELPDTATINFYDSLSFKRNNGNFLKYFCEGDSLFIKYGNNSFSKTLPNALPCIMPYSLTPMLWAEEENRFLLSFGCGLPCWGLMDLPLDPNEELETYMYHYDYDQENNLLIHMEYLEDEDRDVLVARNLSTKAFEVIEIEDCRAAFLGYCIDSLALEGRQLFIRATTTEEQESRSIGSQIIRKRISI